MLPWESSFPSLQHHETSDGSVSQNTKLKQAKLGNVRTSISEPRKRKLAVACFKLPSTRSGKFLVGLDLRQNGMGLSGGVLGRWNTSELLHTRAFVGEKAMALSADSEEKDDKMRLGSERNNTKAEEIQTEECHKKGIVNKFSL